MSKKKKKKVDSFWGVDIDHGQEDLLQEFDDFVEGRNDNFMRDESSNNNSVLDAIAKNVLSQNMGDILKQMEENDDRVTYDEETGEAAIDIGYLIDDINGGEFDNDILSSMRTDFDERSSDIRNIRAYFYDELNRFVIDDGIAPTPFCLDTITTDLIYSFDTSNPDDVNEVSESVYDFLKYVISLKHPSLVLTEEDMEMLISKVDVRSASIFKYESYYYVYITDATIKGIFNWVTEMTDDINEYLSVFISLVAAADRADSAFPSTNIEYVENFYESKYNGKNSDINLVFPAYTDDEERLTIDDLSVIDLEELREKVVELILCYIGDDDDDGDDDDEEDENDSEDLPEDDNITTGLGYHVEESSPIEPTSEEDSTIYDVSDVDTESNEDDELDLDVSDFDEIDEIDPSDEDDLTVPVVKKDR